MFVLLCYQNDKAVKFLKTIQNTVENYKFALILYTTDMVKLPCVIKVAYSTCSSLLDVLNDNAHADDLGN